MQGLFKDFSQRLLLSLVLLSTMCSEILTSNMMIGYMYLSAFNQNATNVDNGVLARKEQKPNAQWLFFPFDDAYASF